MSTLCLAVCNYKPSGLTYEILLPSIAKLINRLLTMNIRYKIRILFFVPLTLLVAWAAYADTLPPSEVMKLEKARVKYPEMVILSYHNSADENTPITLLYNLPYDKTTKMMSIDNKTGDIITDHAYSKPEKVKALELEKLVDKLSGQYQIATVKKSTLHRSEERITRTIHYVDPKKIHRAIIVDAVTGQVLESTIIAHNH